MPITQSRESNTDRRARLAPDRIATIVAEIERAGKISPQQVKWLYSQYRLLFRSKRPFHKSIADATAEATPRLADAIATILDHRNAQETGRRAIVDALVRVHTGFGDDQDFILLEEGT